MLDAAFADCDREKVLLGFDFPIGLPHAYGTQTGLTGFSEALASAGHGAWSDFFEVADEPSQVSLARPFYPRTSRKGVSRATLVKGLSVPSFEDLLRVCERRTVDRQAACSLFWTLGGNQVGKAAIAGWMQVVRPALAYGAALWPFDGTLADLSARPGVVIAETYPAEAYRMFDGGFRRNESKRRQADRASKAPAILKWAADHAVVLSDETIAAVLDGFGNGASGEDAFDAVAGLVKMIEVASERRLESTLDLHPALTWEGWILGR